MGSTCYKEGEKMKQKIAGLMLAVLVVITVSAVVVLVNVSANPDGGTNIALNPDGTGYPNPLESWANAAYNNEGIKWGLIDGEYNSILGQSSYPGLPSGNPYGSTTYIIVDFGVPREFDEVKVWTASPHYDGGGPYSVEYLQSAIVWQKVQYWYGGSWRDVTGDVWGFDTSSEATAMTCTFDPVTYSKVRYVWNSQYWYYIQEFEVFGNHSSSSRCWT